MQPDVVVKDHGGNTKVIIEVKNRENLTSDTAAHFYRNWLAHGLIPSAQYFLIISQDFGYLWDRHELNYNQPSFRFEMNDVIRRYLPSLEINNRLKESELEFLILQWFMDLTFLKNETDSEPERLLKESGLIDSINGGVVVAEAQA